MELEIIKTIVSIGSPFIASYLTYIFVVKGKQKDTDFIKRNELNNVLSHLLIVWNYLIRLDNICKLKYDETIILPISKDYLSVILLKSKILNEDSFQELEESIRSLKKYDPISFFELEGIGRELEFLKTSFILPFIKSSSSSEINKKVSDKYLKLTIDEIENFIESVAKSIDKETQVKAINKLQRKFEKDSEKLKNEILQEYYEFTIQINLNNNLTYEQFITEIEKPEYQDMIKQQYNMINNIDIEKIIELAADDPNISIEQVLEKLSQQIKM